MRSIFFHEDDYCQRQLLPLSSLSFCLKELGIIEDFSRAHENGIGWDSVHVRTEPPVGLISLNILLSEFRLSVSSALPEYDEVFTGYSTYREKCRNAYAFGKDGGSALFCDTDEDSRICSIWMTYPIPEILNLPFADQVLYVDWNWNFVCPLQDRNRIEEYLSEEE